jgi:hypothetical protein
LFERIQAVHAGHADVQHGHVPRFPPEQVQHLVGITSLADFRAVKSLDYEIPHSSPKERKIINHKNF